jgi:hypothetical protein
MSARNTSASTLTATSANCVNVGESQPPRPELLAEHPILRLEIVDHFALLLVDPAGQGD